MTRHFDVCDVFWVVHDFNLATCPNNSSIQSPPFIIIGSHTTKWVLQIEFENDEAGTDMAFNLQRSEFQTGPKQVNVNWRLSMQNPVDDLVFKDGFCIMEESTQYRESLRDCANLIKIFKSDEIEVLTLKCTMIIYTDISEKEFQRSSHKGKMSLSESLINLLNRGYMCDLVLQISDRRIRVHKAFMCARLEIFRHLIKKARKENVASNEATNIPLYKCTEIDVIDLSFLKHNAVESLVKYVYSGNLVHVLLKPTLDIYDCVKKLQICNATINLGVNKFTVESTMDIYQIEQPCIIENFSEHFFKGIESPYAHDRFGIGWKLFLIPNLNSDYFSAFVQSIGGTTSANMLLEISIIDETRNPLLIKRLRCSMADFRNSNFTGFEKFVRKDEIQSYLKNDTLHLCLKIKLSSGMSHSLDKGYEFTVIKYTGETNPFDLLSLHMYKLLQTSEFSDVQLCFEDVTFELHRCILITRSRYFLCLLVKEHGKYKIKDQNVGFFSTDVYKMFFTYLYSGVVETEDKDHLYKLKLASSIYGLPVLKELVEDIESKKQ